MSFKISTNKKFHVKSLGLILLLLFTLNTFSQSFESRSTDVKIQRLSFLIEQMYVEEVDQNKVQKDLVLGMYNYLRPMALYQPDSILEKIGIKPSEKASLGFSIKFKKGKILVDSVFTGSGADISNIKKDDQVLKVNNNNGYKIPKSEISPWLSGISLGEILNTMAESTYDALKENRRAVRSISIPNISVETISSLMVTFILEVLVVAELLGVDPYTQDAVEAIKINTFKRLKNYEYNKKTT